MKIYFYGSKSLTVLVLTSFCVRRPFKPYLLTTFYPAAKRNYLDFKIQILKIGCMLVLVCMFNLANFFNSSKDIIKLLEVTIKDPLNIINIKTYTYIYMCMYIYMLYMYTHIGLFSWRTLTATLCF